jgi:Tol biopolymer transport system component
MKKFSTGVFSLITILFCAGMLCQCNKSSNNDDSTTWKPGASDKIFFSSLEGWGIGKINMIDSTGVSELISMQGWVDEMEISQDAAKIFFTSSGTIYSGQILGHSVTVNNQISGGLNLDLAPDGSKLVFERLGVNDRDSMYTSNADGTGLSFIGLGRDPQWSPDGIRILFCLGDSIYTANQDGTGRSVTAKGMSPVWTPGGQRIYYYDSGGWWSFDLSGSQINKLFDLLVASCTWSPDRTKLCFRMQDGNLYIREITGTSPVKVFNDDPANSIYSINWSPDGTQIIFSREQGAGQDVSIFIVNADGSKVWKIASPKGYCTSVEWR